MASTRLTISLVLLLFCLNQTCCSTSMIWKGYRNSTQDVITDFPHGFRCYHIAGASTSKDGSCVCNNNTIFHATNTSYGCFDANSVCAGTGCSELYASVKNIGNNFILVFHRLYHYGIFNCKESRQNLCLVKWKANISKWQNSEWKELERNVGLTLYKGSRHSQMQILPEVLSDSNLLHIDVWHENGKDDVTRYLVRIKGSFAYSTPTAPPITTTTTTPTAPAITTTTTTPTAPTPTATPPPPKTTPTYVVANVKPYSPSLETEENNNSKTYGKDCGIKFQNTITIIVLLVILVLLTAIVILLTVWWRESVKRVQELLRQLESQRPMVHYEVPPEDAISITEASESRISQQNQELVQNVKSQTPMHNYEVLPDDDISITEANESRISQRNQEAIHKLESQTQIHDYEVPSEDNFSMRKPNENMVSQHSTTKAYEPLDPSDLHPSVYSQMSHYTNVLSGDQ